MPQEEEKKPATQDPQIQEKLLKTRSIILSGEIDKESAESVIKQMLILEGESSEPIKIFINSPGGDVDAGYAIFDMARFINAPVTMVGMGLVASAAALVLLAVPKEQRIALPNSTYLIHQPMSGMRGVATDIEIHALHLEKLREKLDKLIAQETGKSLEEVRNDTERDHWLSADEALSYGLVSRIITQRSEL
ncbi:ATP-dependent Clp protease proteolytic subunit [Sphaerochaeta halotolerans]|uniref:ATP-dependent Clp protease proteolytic subunit n=1 Tax=Sphaerochaeta halotolerans TaxID=2293840 RepID=A0A372MLD5_9SPIR|nr:ATP-dependent Clp protease proteolytic subunit [Sphaerochaeta halotolerans]MBG0766479.1 ATP-dependent Clp protease proteolytic subunit [Spirochaetaceae bacterium]MDK2860424.1 ATP-dependent Clp protease, protease subunit [Sphaerochaeta sp.]MDN5334672.1 ATP-dependent Clp protease, protease subunit [Sphaerochaeta sp.]MXI86159.1 ATP-dependent Clp protease proteolytic subunit [Sphaerochaeta halotolerans]RFU95990.1 ATP-dependent Clp protease proteolytic subunit [Sphaerochaeta halotolerans]